ncbi:MULTISPECIES: efflux transporter outer membrane subunit [unclassified Variovorax]|uniref:efflux transporter outer membrane subunit n=1 Tax=unclassified Variovorax TaxID=663243 RepID=UPI003F46A445
MTLLVSMFLVAGCAVGPDYHAPPVTLPVQWATTQDRTLSSAAPDLSRWWTRLDDPLLNALVDEAVAGNLDVATASAKIREARATYNQAAGSLVPSLTSTASATRSVSNGVASGGTTGTTSTGLTTSSGGNTFKAGFDASWELDLFGANRRAVEAAGYGVDAAQWSLRSTLLTLIGDITSNYIQARGYQTRLALARDTVSSQEETARITQVKFDAGASSGLDAANATGQAQTTKAAIPTLESSYAQTVHSLSVLTGQAPAALMQRLQAVEPIPTPPLPIALGIPANVLLARPDVLLAERQYAQYTAKIGQAEAARYPSVSLTGSLSTSGKQVGDLAKHSSIGWSFGPSVTLPLFNGSKLKATVDITRAQRDQYFIAYQSSVLAALKDVENAAVGLSQETARVQNLEASVDAYRQAASLSQLLYQAGSTGFLDVLTAQRSLYTSQDALIQSRVLITTQYIALNKALGGGWDGEIDTSTPAVTDSYTGPRLSSAE